MTSASNDCGGKCYRCNAEGYRQGYRMGVQAMRRRIRLFMKFEDLDECVENSTGNMSYELPKSRKEG